MSQGGDGGCGEGAGAPAVAAEGAATAPLLDLNDMELGDAKIKMHILHCQACRLPLKPPVFTCEVGHIVCKSDACHGKHGEKCGGAVAHCGAMDAVASAVKVGCAFKPHGCERFLVYHEAEEHRRAHEHAPCSCPHPGCAFSGSPHAALLDHIATHHPALPIWHLACYGRKWNMNLPLSQPRQVLVVEEERSVFLVSLQGGLGGATTVSVVVVRSNAAATPDFSCKLSVKLSYGDALTMADKAVRSSSLSGGVPAPEPGKPVVTLHPGSLLGEVLPLSIRIDKIGPPPPPPGPADASAKPKAALPETEISRKRKTTAPKRLECYELSR